MKWTDPDHVGGLAADGQRVFANATVHADKADADFWLSQANMEKAPADKKGFFQGAMASVNPYRDAGKLKPFSGATELVPGIRAVPFGHMGDGNIQAYNDDALAQQVVFQTSALPAEVSACGVRVNMIPKEGGNIYVAEGIAYGYHQKFASDNLTDSLRSAGFKFAPQIFSYDFNPVFGGPIKKNKLWFFGSYTANNQNSYVLDTYFKEGHPSTPPGKGGQLADTGAHLNTGETIRVTNQVSSKHKLRFSYDNLVTITPRGNFGRGTQPEAAWYLALKPTWLAQVKYTAPLTSRLLVEAGFSYQRGDFNVDFQPNNPKTAITLIDLATGITSENHILSYRNTEKKKEAKISLSYITGSHSFKTGFEDRWASARQSNPFNSDINYRTVINGVANTVAVTNGPAANVMEMRFDGGAYAQDQWKIGRATINAGARWDRFNAGIPAQSAPAGYFTPAVTLAEISNTPNWNDFSIRLGGAYDVFGNGKTAVKAHMGKYVAGHALSRTSQFNPLFGTTDVRSWTDLDRNGTVVNPDGTPQYAEIGPSRNPAFGQLVGTDKLDPKLPRDKNWSYEASVQHELFPRVSVSGSYFHRYYYDIAFTDNLATTNSDWIPFQVPVPVDSRLPGGGGGTLTAYNLNPAKFGQTNNLLTLSNNWRTYDGLEFNMNFRLPGDAFAMTSWTAGKTHSWDCDMENPNGSTTANGRIDCDSNGPFRHIYKASGGLPLPLNIMLSGVFQIYDTPGSGLALVPPYVRSNYTITRAVAAASGVDLTGGISQNMNLVRPNTVWNDYYKVLDLRVSKRMSMGKLKSTVLVEFENILNMTNIVTVQETFGANWLRPTSIQNGRRVRFGLQMRY